MKNKLIFAILISVFLMGIVLSPVSASHTYKKGGYKFTVSDHQYKQIQYVKKHKYTENLKTYAYFLVKTNKYYTSKKPVYKTKTVKTHKWKYKYVLQNKFVYKYKNYDSTEYTYSTKKYDENWKWYGSFDRYYYYSWGEVNKHYFKYKKKVKLTKKKKVKVGTKKVKLRVYAHVETYYSLGIGHKVKVTFRAMPSKNEEDLDRSTTISQYYL